jgi:hypothetical protein
MVANGDKVISRGICRGLDILVGTEPFTVDCYALPLKGYDIVLGVQWLRLLAPICWDFIKLTMSFWHRDHHVTLHGKVTPGSRAFTCEGQDLLATLLQDFEGLFMELRTLPPPRSCDHRIHLLPGMAPVVVRPYRYPTPQRDEIERQCADMLARGLIRRSQSEFSSPVLLVKKQDDSKCFCIDYRAHHQGQVSHSSGGLASR